MSGKETVLLVEDAQEVRKVEREILKSYGYRVLEVDSLAQAGQCWLAPGSRAERRRTH